MIKDKMNAFNIANIIFTDGGRARDCDIKNNLKNKYNESFIEKVLEQLAIIEYNHLMRQGTS